MWAGSLYLKKPDVVYRQARFCIVHSAWPARGWLPIGLAPLTATERWPCGLFLLESRTAASGPGMQAASPGILRATPVLQAYLLCPTEDCPVREFILQATGPEEPLKRQGKN